MIFQKLHPSAKLPQLATDGAAGYDLTAVSVEATSDGRIKIKFGIATAIPKGYVGLLFPRSSISKRNLMQANSVGVIDSDYRGEIMQILRYPDQQALINNYKAGERTAQLVVVPIKTTQPRFVKQLSTTKRGEGGFGSTGK